MLDDDPHADARPPASGGDRLFLFAFCLLLFGLFAAEVLREVTPGRLATLAFFAMWGVLTVLHEAAHAIVARRVGWRVDRVQLGFGPTIGQPRIGGVPVEIRAFPIVGLVEMVPDRIEGARWKSALIYAAGPGIELLVAAIIATAVGWSTLLAASDHWGIVFAQSACLAAVVGAGLNLLPFSPRPGQVTDGLGILRSPFVPRVAFEMMMIGPELHEGFARIRHDADGALAYFEAMSARYPRVILVRAGIARALDALGRREEALLRLHSFVRQTDPDDRAEAEAILDAFRASPPSRS